MDGQMNMIDFMVDKTGFNCGEAYRSEGYTNAYDAMPDHECEVEVIDHEGNRFKSEVKLSFGFMVFDTNKYHDRGYDICWWREIKPKTCRTCSHWKPYTHGWEPAPVGYACFPPDTSISKSSNPDQLACDTYEERGDL